MTPRRLRVRLIDDEGDAVDGKDVEMVGTNSGNGYWTCRVKQFGTWNYHFPFAPFQASGRGAQVQVAPLWFSQGVWAPEFVVLATFSLPEDDLELIERIEVELIRPGG